MIRPLFLALFACSVFAQEPPELAAPVYRIPFPETLGTPRAAGRLPKVDDAWERAFLECLVTMDDRARMARFLELLAGTPVEKFPAGSQAFVRMDGLGLFTMRVPERDFFWEQYGRLARESAVKEAALLAVKDATRYAGLPRKALQGWAEVAPADAVKWFSSRPEPVVGDPLMLRPLLLGWAVSDLKAATAFMVENAKPGAREFQDALTGLRDFVATRDFTPGLIEWFGTLPEQDVEPTVKAIALVQVLHRVEAAGMAEAGKFLDSIPNEKVVTSVVIQRHASAWARVNPLEAMQWALSRPKDAKGNRAGVPMVTQVWAGKDAKAFGQWLLDNRAHESIDHVLLGFVKYLATRDINEAKKWAKEIKTPAIRTEAEEAL